MAAKLLALAALLAASAAQARMSGPSKAALEAAYHKGRDSCFGSTFREDFVASGFRQPCAGLPQYLKYSPPRANRTSQIHAPIGAARAEYIARATNFPRSDTMSPALRALFLSGGGVGGSAYWANITRRSMLLLTNTKGRPINGAVLASYGLLVDDNGMLMSIANAESPARLANGMLEPGGYMGTWLKANNATRQLLALYQSAYPASAAFGLPCQLQAGTAELVSSWGDEGGRSMVAMPLAPPIWMANFDLLYLLDPHTASKLPAYWQPLPPAVAAAIMASPNGQVPYARYKHLLVTE